MSLFFSAPQHSSFLAKEDNLLPVTMHNLTSVLFFPQKTMPAVFLTHSCYLEFQLHYWLKAS